MKRIALALALVAVSLLLLNAGCYTVLQHPTGSSVVQEGSYYRTCADCHADAAYYHPYGRSYSRYGRSHYRWNDYYGYPWWYDDYWWWDDHDYDDHDNDYDGPDVETGTRHLWGTGGWPSSGWGFTPPGSGTRPPLRPSGEAIRRDEQGEPKQKEKPKDLRPEQLKEKEKPKEKEKDLRPEQLKEKEKKEEPEKERRQPPKNPKWGS